MSVLVSLIAGFILLFSITAADPGQVRGGADRPGRLGDRAAAGADLPRLARPGPGQVPAVHRLRCPVPLRHGLGDRKLAHDVRLLPRQRPAGVADLGQGQPEDWYTDQLDLAVRGAVDHSRLAGAGLRGGVPRRHVDRRHRPLHRVRRRRSFCAEFSPTSNRGRGIWAAGARRSAGSPSSGWPSSASCSCCLRLRRSPCRPSTTRRSR